MHWNWCLVVTWGWWCLPWENTNVLVWQRTYNKVFCPLLVKDPEHYFHIACNSAIRKNSNGNRCLRWACCETKNSLLHKTGTTKWTPDRLMTLDYSLNSSEKRHKIQFSFIKILVWNIFHTSFCFKETSYIWDSEENSHPNYKSNCWKAGYFYYVKQCKKDGQTLTKPS